jgi:hypothetical protein
MSEPKIVQFPHPGPEHRPDKGKGNIKSWHTGKHKRKFMLLGGKYVENDSLKKGKLLFWGEWEPPSGVTRLKQPDDLYPQWLHEPFLPKSFPASRNDTDPFVFGCAFRYGLCKQNTYKQLRDLEKGSLILFGSGKGKGDAAFFQVDTVFVVGGYTEYDGADAKALKGEGDYWDIVFGGMCGAGAKGKSGGKGHAKLSGYTSRLYYGATYEKPCEGMYSFVPARVGDTKSAKGFARVKLGASFPRYINPAHVRGIKITKASGGEEVRKFWEKIRAASRKQGCVEGVRFDMPPVDKKHF